MSRSLLENLRIDHPRNYGWSLVCCGWQQELAEDVLQEAYLRVLDGRAVFSGQSSQCTWFFAVIKYIASDLRRTQERRAILNMKIVAGDLSADAEAFQPSTSEARAASDETSVLLQGALLQLSQRQREVLHLVFYSELTLEEAAVTLDISVGSARTHYHRGKLQLAQLLNLDENNE